MTRTAPGRFGAFLGLLLTVVAVAGCTPPGEGGGASGPPPAPTTLLPAPQRQAANGPTERREDAAQPEAPPSSSAPAATGPALSVHLEAVPDPVLIRFKKPPRAGILVDLDTGQVLWRHNPIQPVPIASVTKIMTALLVAERLPEGSKVKITKEATKQEGSKVGVLPAGKRVGVSALLSGLMLPSGNDAAAALAIRISGSQRAFVRLMNKRAQQLGLGCTRFASPSGIIDRGNYSCPADLAVLARAALDQRRVAKVARTLRASLPFPIKGGRLYLSSHNPLLRTGYPGTLGLKTGYTNAAGRCFVGAAKRKGRRFVVVLLGSPDPGRQARQLLNRGFSLVR